MATKLSTMRESTPIEQQVMLVYVALQNLQHDRSTLEIAEELGISRFKVSRMVNQAREMGLVEVVSKISQQIDVPLSRKLAQTFGLKNALVVVPAANSEQHARESISEAAAMFISDHIEEGDYIGLGPGRTILKMCEKVEDFPACNVVQLTGVASQSSSESIHALYKLGGDEGKVFPLPAPLLATSSEAAEAILAQPTVQETLRTIDKVETAVLTIGGLPRSSLLAVMLKESGDLDALMRKGAICEIGTSVLGVDGEIISDIGTRTIGISTEQLMRVPFRIGLGGGEEKKHAVLATLRSGLVDMVVTDFQAAMFAVENANNPADSK